MSKQEFKGEELPTILCADRFYMTDKAMRAFEGIGKVMWADCKSEDELVEKICNANVKVIISEYFKITRRVMNVSPDLKGGRGLGCWI